MGLYAIADLHLSRAVDKPMDIFGPLWEDHEKRLIENWCLKQDDTIVIAGDLSWAMDMNQLEPDLAMLDSLPGQKILLKGNHDYWWSTQKKLHEFIEPRFKTISFLFNNTYQTEHVFLCGTRGWLLEPGEENDQKVIDREAGRLRLSLQAYQKQQSNKPAYVFLHYPPVFNGTVCEPILQVLKEYQIRECFYGHLHGHAAHELAEKETYEGIHMHLISADYLQFKPLQIF